MLLLRSRCVAIVMKLVRERVSPDSDPACSMPQTRGASNSLLLRKMQSHLSTTRLRDVKRGDMSLPLRDGQRDPTTMPSRAALTRCCRLRLHHVRFHALCLCALLSSISSYCCWPGQCLHLPHISWEGAMRSYPQSLSASSAGPSGSRQDSYSASLVASVAGDSWLAARQRAMAGGRASYAPAGRARDAVEVDGCRDFATTVSKYSA